MTHTFRVIRRAKGKRAKRSPILRTMGEMEIGEKCVHDHTGYHTEFSSWLSQQMCRMQKRFSYTRISKTRPVFLIERVKKAGEAA